MGWGLGRWWASGSECCCGQTVIQQNKVTQEKKHVHMGRGHHSLARDKTLLRRLFKLERGTKAAMLRGSGQ